MPEEVEEIKAGNILNMEIRVFCLDREKMGHGGKTRAVCRH